MIKVLSFCRKSDFVLKGLVTAIVVFYALHLTAQERPEVGVNCVELSNDVERLACYDARHVNSGPDHASPRGSGEGKRMWAPGADTPATSRSLFHPEEPVAFQSSIAAIKAEPQTKMVFRLANGQIWLQSSPRRLRFSVGDVVTIKSGMVGGYMMRNQHQTVARVRRIR